MDGPNNHAGWKKKKKKAQRQERQKKHQGGDGAEALAVSEKCGDDVLSGQNASDPGKTPNSEPGDIVLPMLSDTSDNLKSCSAVETEIAMGEQSGGAENNNLVVDQSGGAQNINLVVDQRGGAENINLVVDQSRGAENINLVVDGLSRDDSCPSRPDGSIVYASWEEEEGSKGREVLVEQGLEAYVAVHSSPSSFTNDMDSPSLQGESISVYAVRDLAPEHSGIGNSLSELGKDEDSMPYRDPKLQEQVHALESTDVELAILEFDNANELEQEVRSPVLDLKNDEHGELRGAGQCSEDIPVAFLKNCSSQPSHVDTLHHFKGDKNRNMSMDESFVDALDHLTESRSSSLEESSFLLKGNFLEKEGQLSKLYACGEEAEKPESRMVRIGLNPLHRQGIKTFAFCCLLDQRWRDFGSAIIGGIQAPLSEGPISFDVYPNFSIALEDPHVMTKFIEPTTSEYTQALQHGEGEGLKGKQKLQKEYSVHTDFELPSSSFQIHSNRLPYCTYPDCKVINCQKHRLEINMLSIDYPSATQQRTRIPKRKLTRKGLGFNPNVNTFKENKFVSNGMLSSGIPVVPQQRIDANNKLPESERLTVEEMSLVCSHLHGYDGFDQKNIFMQKLYLWDRDTHPLGYPYKLQSFEERQSFGKKWIDYMKENDKWVSCIELFYGLIPEEIEFVPLKQFDNCKYDCLMHKPNKRTFGETFLVEVNMMETEEPPKKKVVWTKHDGSEIHTIWDIPPWEDLKIDRDGKTYQMRTLAFDDPSLTKEGRMNISLQNWANIAEEKHYYNLTERLNVIGKEQRSLLKTYVANIDKNVVSISTKMDHSNDLIINEFQSMNRKQKQSHDIVSQTLISMNSKMESLDETLSELKLDISNTNQSVNWLVELKKKSQEEREKRNKSILQSKKNVITQFSFPAETSYTPQKEVFSETKTVYNFGSDVKPVEMELPNWFETIRLPTPESTKSKETTTMVGSSSSKSLHDDDDVHFINALESTQEPLEVHANYSNRWKVAPDLSRDTSYIPPKEWSPSSIVCWSIDNKTPDEIELLLANMFTCYKTYLTAGTDPVSSVNNILIGFEGTLRSWYIAMSKKYPDIVLKAWPSQQMLNDLGQPQVLADGSIENNYIGRLIGEIRLAFVGQVKDMTVSNTLALNQMKLKKMEHFHEHFEEYRLRLFSLPDCLDSKWMHHFISTLPTWFAKRYLEGITIGQDFTWGMLYQTIKMLIFTLCQEQHQIKKVTSSSQKYLIDPLCSQYHVFSPKKDKNQGGKKRSKMKKKHKERQQEFHPAHKKYKEFPRRHKHNKPKNNAPHRYVRKRGNSSKRSGQDPPTITCWKCGGAHMMASCPKLAKKDKSVKQEVHRLQKELNSLCLSESDSESSSDQSEYSIEVMNLNKIENDESDNSCSEYCACKECMGTDGTDSSSTEEEVLQINTISVEQENAILEAVMASEDRETRRKIFQALQNTPKKEEKVKLDPVYLTSSLERNTAQFMKKEAPLLDINSLNRSLKDLESRVYRLEGMAYYQELGESSKINEDYVTVDEKPKDLIKQPRDPEKGLFINSITVKKPQIQLKAKINNEWFEDLTVLIDTGSDVNAIRTDLVSHHHRLPSDINQVNTIQSPSMITAQTRVLLQLGEKKKKILEISCVLIDSLSCDMFLGTPFTHAVAPIIFDKNMVKFSYQKKNYSYPYSSNPRLSYQINRLEARIEELKEVRISLSLEQLLQRKDIVKRIDEVKASFQKLFGIHLGMFWEKKKHFVSLPYKDSYKERARRSKAFSMNADQKEMCFNEIDELLKQGLIKESSSPWGCFGFYVNKHSEIKRGKPRLVINYKPLNDALEYDSYPLPKPSDILAKVKSAKVFSKFDLKSGFWQICINPDDTYKTGFTVPRGHFEWLVMPFGLKNAPSAFQRIMDKTFKDLDAFIQTYIDDLLVFSDNIEDHFKHLKIVRQRILDEGLVLSEKKAEFFKTKISFLGFELFGGSFTPMGHSLEFVDKFPDVILDKTQLQRFLGCLNYVSNFYEDCAADRDLLNKRIRKNPPPWTDAHTLAVRKIKQKVKELPILHLYREDWVTEIYTDASDEGWGAGLVQWDPALAHLPEHKKQRQICRFASGRWDTTQKAWDSNKKELAAVLKAVKKFRDFIVWKKFVLYTDNKAIPSMFVKKDSDSAVTTRWLMQLSDFDMQIKHIAGVKNCLADMLSREHISEDKQVNMLNAEIRNTDWEDWTYQWSPQEELRYSWDEPGEYNVEQRNDIAIRALENLRNMGMIQYNKFEHTCIVWFKFFPLQINPSIEEDFFNMFLYQNDRVDMSYVCLLNAYMNPTCRWFKNWREKWMLSPLSSHPENVCHYYIDSHDYPRDTDDALRRWTNRGYQDWLSHQDWIVKTHVYQRKQSGPQAYDSDAPWYAMDDFDERGIIQQMISCDLNADTSTRGGEIKTDVTVQYMHEELDFYIHTRTGNLSSFWHDTYANKSIDFTLRRHAAKYNVTTGILKWMQDYTPRLILHRPRHSQFYASEERRFQFYSTKAMEVEGKISEGIGPFDSDQEIIIEDDPNDDDNFYDDQDEYGNLINMIEG